MNSTQLANLNRLKKIASGGGGGTGGGVEKEYVDTALSNKADKEHVHDASAIETGTLPLTRGGTGTSLAKTNNAIIRFSGSGNYFSKTATGNGAFYATASNGSPKFGTLPVAQGGTGATTPEDALTNLGASPVGHTHDEYLTDQDVSGKANVSDLTSHTGNTTVHITANERTAWNNKMNDMTIELYNGTGGNPKPVRFASFNYSTCSSEHGLAVKISMVSGHGNGTSYAFLQDVIIRVSYSGGVEVDNLKYYGASTGSYDGATRQYGDIFWLFDATNSIVDFYCLMGQYARVYQSPWKRLTYSTGGTVTQYTSCTVYASGEKNWANNSEIATLKDLESSGIIYSEATQLSSGLMSASDKKKLDGIATGANNTTVDDTLYSWSTNPVQNKVVTDALSKKADGTTLNSHTGDTTVHITSAERTAWNNKSNFSGNYNDLTNKPTIPSVPVQSVNGKTGAVQLTASDVGALSTSGGTVSGSLGVSGGLIQGNPSTDSTITSMNRFQNDLFIEGTGSAPNNPRVAGFYLGKSATDANRHLDIVSGDTYSYIDFNKDNRQSDYDVRLLVNVVTGDTQFMWGPDGALTQKQFNVLGTLMQYGAPVALKSDIKSTTTAHVVLYGDRWDSSSAGYTQVVTDSRITADALLLVGPEPSAVRMYGQYGVVCTSQGNGTLTFTASVKPTTALGVNVFILG